MGRPDLYSIRSATMDKITLKLCAMLSCFLGFVYACFRALLDSLFRVFFLMGTMIRVAHACCPHSLNLESLGRIMSVGHGALQRLDRGPAPVTDDVPQHTFGTHV